MNSDFDVNKRKYNVDKIYQDFKLELIQLGFMGDVSYEFATRLINATDNSIYEILPDIIVTPKHSNDLELMLKLLNQQKYMHISCTARGGGTGTNAQSLNRGVLVDFSRYMCNITDLDIEEKTLSVESGVILSKLNEYLFKYKLFFAPNISTADRATIGGMFATDAAGRGSLVYGKTSDHVLAIEFILINGDKYSYDLQNNSLMPLGKNTDITAANIINTSLVKLLNTKDVQLEIANRFPPLHRPLTGYNLKEALSAIDFSSTITKDPQINFIKLLAGSEGTLAFITKLKLKLCATVQYKKLIIIHYANFLQALDHAKELLQFQPLAIEVVDEKIQELAKNLTNYETLAKLMAIKHDEEIVSNFVEFAASDISQLQLDTNNLIGLLDSKSIRYVVIDDTRAMNQLWSLRAMAVGLLANLKGDKKPVAFVEDIIVPVTSLFDFVKDFKLLLDSHHLQYAMYGHLDVGCIHVRPALNMQDILDRNKIKTITIELVSLLDKYHGLLWGEHGKGVRGEFIKDVFGDYLFNILQQIKYLFDPRNRLNTGKLLTPVSNNRHDNQVKTYKQFKILKIDEVTMRGELDANINNSLKTIYSDALNCNGNALCFNQNSNNRMCPSYKLSKDRLQSPKGRAMLLKEWLRFRSSTDQTLTKNIAETLFKTMNTCLSCDSCANDCPAQVSIANLRAQFLNDYYKLYKKRGLAEYLQAYLEHALYYISYIPQLWNLLIYYKIYKIIPKKMLAIVNPPLASINRSLSSILKSHNLKLIHKFDDLQKYRLQLTKPNKIIIIIMDVFTAVLNDNVLINFCLLLLKFDYIPIVIYPQILGKSFLVSGMLTRFLHAANNIKTLLSSFILNDVPIVCLENSMSLLLNNDYKKYGIELFNSNSNKQHNKIYTIADIMVQLINSKDDTIQKIALYTQNLSMHHQKIQYVFLPHCSTKSRYPVEYDNWMMVYNAFGLNAKVLELSCCGMSGTYGHTYENYKNSQQIYNLSWKPNIQLDQKNIHYLVTGYSCKSQVSLLDKQILQHPIDHLYNLIINHLR